MGEKALDILADFDATYIPPPGDGGHTHTTQPHATRTYMQDARKAAEGPVHSATPTTPHQTHTTPIPPLLTPPLNQSPHLHAAWAHGENANKAQEKTGNREVRPGGDVDDGGGTELIASQDEPHGEEPAIAHAPADEEEEQGLGEWAAEEENEEHEEVEQVPATEAGGPDRSHIRCE